MKILADIIDWRDKLKAKRIHPNEYDYISTFQQAQMNTRALKLFEPEFQFDENYSSGENKKPNEDIFAVMHYTFSSFSEKDLANNCTTYSKLAQEALKWHLNLDTVLTLGSYNINNSPKRHFESLTKIKYRLKNPQYTTKGINIHAWLTLPDWKIIDVTLPATVSTSLKLNYEGYQDFLFLDVELQKGKNATINYFPLILGQDLLTKIPLSYERVLVRGFD